MNKQLAAEQRRAFNKLDGKKAPDDMVAEYLEAKVQEQETNARYENRPQLIFDMVAETLQYSVNAVEALKDEIFYLEYKLEHMGENDVKTRQRRFKRTLHKRRRKPYDANTKRGRTV